MSSSSTSVAALATQYGVTPETVQIALLSFAADVGDPPKPIEEVPEPTPATYLVPPDFPQANVNESDEDYNARMDADELERKHIRNHNNAERIRFRDSFAARESYLSYLEAKHVYEQQWAAQFPDHLEKAKATVRDAEMKKAARRAAEEAAAAQPADPPARPTKRPREEIQLDDDDEEERKKKEPKKPREDYSDDSVFILRDTSESVWIIKGPYSIPLQPATIARSTTFAASTIGTTYFLPARSATGKRTNVSFPAQKR